MSACKLCKAENGSHMSDCPVLVQAFTHVVEVGPKELQSRIAQMLVKQRALEAENAGLRGEIAVLLASADACSFLLTQAARDQQALRQKLDWFEKRESYVRRAVEATPRDTDLMGGEVNALAHGRTDVLMYEHENPKPEVGP